MNKLSIDIKWENNHKFSVESKLNDEDKVTIVSTEENSHLMAMWREYCETVDKYLKTVMEDIRIDMAQA